MLDIVLLLVALVACERALLPAIPAALGAVAGGLAVCLIGYRIAVPPDPTDQLVAEAPAWIALAGAIIVLAGSLAALAADRRAA